MKRLFIAAIGILSSWGIFSSASAERMLEIKIGPTWPRELLSTGIPTGDAEILYGFIIDKKVAFGIAGNFLWNARSKDVQVRDTASGAVHNKIVNGQSSFMFPIMGFFQIDPVPNLIVHPVAHFQIGYNSMIYNYSEADSAGAQKRPLSPYFYGLIIKTGADALYNLGERSSLLVGMEYRWADTKTASTKGLFDKRNMGGIGFSAGFRVTL